MAIRKASNSGLEGSVYKDASAKTSKIVDIPDAPIIGTATAGEESATITYTVANTGGIGTTFTALSNPGSITGTGSSPITVSGLTGEVSYTFTVRSGNTTGDSPYSSASNSVTPTALPLGSYESIATVTPNGSGVTFSSIPQGYKHLQIRALVRTSRNDATTDVLTFTFNGDGANNYATHGLVGNGSSASAYGYIPYATPIYLDGIPSSTAAANTFGVAVIDILDYTNTNKYKTVRGLGGADYNGSGQIRLVSGVWLSTTAVTSITFGSVGSYLTNSSFALYGIKG